MSALTDERARDRICTDTASTLFVEAGAGSGKTRSLVDRVTTLVLVDGVRMEHIAAVTFTEKAGAELRDRLRANFESVWRNETGDRRDRAANALEDLDSAAIGTLHSFAQRILTMFPIAAGLPPLLEVLDEVASSVAFDERWSVLQRELLDDSELSGSVLLALAAGAKLEHLRSLARAFGNDWDLIDDKVLIEDPPPAPRLPDVRGLVDEAARLAALSDRCRKETDLFLPKLDLVRAWGQRLGDAVDDAGQLAVLREIAEVRWGVGAKGNWSIGLDDLRSDCGDLQGRANEIVAEVLDSTLRILSRWVAAQVRLAAGARAAEGRLEFHDLLVLARGLLRERAYVRAALQEQWPRLLLDEFQDTDPIQIELAVRIAGGAEADAVDWRDVRVPPGSLFVVGDPKQSIYRFRRASIETYLLSQSWVGDTVKLTTNFRTVGHVLDWVNAVFGSVIQYEPEAQPSYEALDTHRAEPGEGPAVVVLGRDEHTDKPKAADLREREAADVAAVIARALRERWTIWNERRETWRPLELGDVAILVPARTSLPFLEDALDRAGVPYRAESSSLVYQAGEVRDLMAAARTVADPSDLLSCVTALRSPLFGCGDDDLWTWKRDGGSFNVLAPIDEERLSHPVGAAVRYLQRLHYGSRWMTPSEVLATLVADRRMLEVAASGPRARDQWRRLRFVVDQARAWSEVEHGGLRAYLAWAARQGEEASRVAEAVLPETDVDAVRIMTVHAAKGLEFPMVVLSGMSSAPRGGGGVRVLWYPNGYAVRLTKSVQTNDFEAVQPVDEQMDAQERKRLLYVATTRARDHLVVSLHRAGRTQSNAKLLADNQAGQVAGAVPFTATANEVSGTLPVRQVADVPPEWNTWLERLEAARAASRKAAAVSASGLEGTEPAVALEPQAETSGAAKGGRDVELPPWSKGRYGSAIGRAVHGVLQSVDLASGDGLDDAVSAQCVAEGVMTYADLVRALAQSALDSHEVKRAAARPHWRESYVGMLQDDGTFLEGFVDLIYREDDGSLRIVDYKTDDIPSEAVAVRSSFYAPQMAAYRQVLEAASSTNSGTRLLFLFNH